MIQGAGGVGDAITGLNGILTAVIGILGGLTLLIPRIQSMLREIRRPSTEDYKRIVELEQVMRRVVRHLKGTQCWDDLDPQLREDMEKTTI